MKDSAEQLSSILARTYITPDFQFRTMSEDEWNAKVAAVVELMNREVRKLRSEITFMLRYDRQRVRYRRRVRKG